MDHRSPFALPTGSLQSPQVHPAEGMMTPQHNDGPDPAEEQHLQFLSQQLVQPSPVQPLHHDNIQQGTGTPQSRSSVVTTGPASNTSFDRNAAPPSVSSAQPASNAGFQPFSPANILSHGPMTPMTPVTPGSSDPGIVPQLQNIVSTVNLGCRLDLKKIALHARNAEYNPKRFAAVIMRIREPRTTALIFSSGKMVCTGAKSEEQSRLAARKYARIVQKLGFDVSKFFK